MADVVGVAVHFLTVLVLGLVNMLGRVGLAGRGLAGALRNTVELLRGFAASSLNTMEESF